MPLESYKTLLKRGVSQHVTNYPSPSLMKRHYTNTISPPLIQRSSLNMPSSLLTSSVFGKMMGRMESLNFVRCSYAYAILINVSSVHLSPKKLSPNGEPGYEVVSTVQNDSK